MEAKGNAVATLLLMVMVINVNSVHDHEALITHDDGKILSADCYKICYSTCFSKPINYRCIMNCHLKCRGSEAENFLQYCNKGCLITYCSKFSKGMPCIYVYFS